MDIVDLHNTFLASTGVCIDTRSIEAGNLFFALKGDNFNGNLFAEKAIQDGASFAIVDEKKFEEKNYILVNNVLETLQKLAKYHREQLTIPIIGLTGSNGKTTTKELIYAALSNKYNTLATAGNFNNHIGVPLTLLRIQPQHELAIIEMGANHQKEIEFLCSLSQPDIGYITNFGKAHLEGFGGIEGVIKGKSELYDYLRGANKQVLVNLDDKKQLEKSKGISSIKFGEFDKTGDYTFDYVTHSKSFLSLAYQNIEIATHLTGSYNFSNLSAAISLGLHFGVPLMDVKAGIESYSPSNNRSQVSHTEHNTLVIDAYNANPSSMEAAIINFKEFDKNPKWMILGDMFELGEVEQEEHLKIIQLIEQLNFVDKIFLIGEIFFRCKIENPSFIQIKTTDDLLARLEKEKVVGKTILVKGSRGMKLERSIPLL
jgi:UDP-N-acetylmuramoyl-tripeptide--D-alanyl-D-alanine ligase